MDGAGWRWVHGLVIHEKKTSGLIEISMWSNRNFQLIDFIDNIQKHSCVFPAVFVLCKMNIFLLSSVSSMIINSMDWWVGG